MEKKEETKRRILDAAIIEFGTNGYTLASTNQMYQSAQVAKGTIFLYFSSKAELFYAVFCDCLQRLMDAITRVDLTNIEDVYEKMVFIALWKLEYFNEKTNDANILLEAISSPPADTVSKIMQHMDQMSILSINYFFDDIDMNRFSDEYSKEEVMRYIQMSLNGMQSMMKKEKLTLSYLESVRKDYLKYLKTVLKGMEK